MFLKKCYTYLDYKIEGMEKRMEEYAVETIFHKINNNHICVSVPGSKSITNRALMLAALADGTTVLEGVLFSDDSRHFLQCLVDLGFSLTIDEAACQVKIQGCSGRIPKEEASIYVGSAGTAARFLTAMLGLTTGIYHLDASEQMRKRPMKPLLDCLIGLGAEVSYEGEPGFFPFTIKGCGQGAREVTININHSSQFLSALLMSAPMTKENFTIHIEGDHGMAYIHMTMKLMEQFGVTVKQVDEHTYIVAGEQQYRSRKYQIEPDVSAACYFYGMAPLLGITAQVKHVHRDSLQGDIGFLDILKQMGCKIEEASEGILVYGMKDGQYPGVQVDMGSCSDQTMTLAALAVFASSPTEITGIRHIRLQESNRIAAVVTELTRMGIQCEEKENGIIIQPGQPRPAEIETYDDHRMAMAFSLIGLRTEGMIVKNPMCCRKTFEQYFTVLDDVIKRLTDA
jgi:3-phosphoshikimate 1-carboxyvinyltransferase